MIERTVVGYVAFTKADSRDSPWSSGSSSITPSQCLTTSHCRRWPQLVEWVLTLLHAAGEPMWQWDDCCVGCCAGVQKQPMTSRWSVQASVEEACLWSSAASPPPRPTVVTACRPQARHPSLRRDSWSVHMLLFFRPLAEWYTRHRVHSYVVTERRLVTDISVPTVSLWLLNCVPCVSKNRTLRFSTKSLKSSP